jgi:hypothetical protein
MTTRCETRKMRVGIADEGSVRPALTESTHPAPASELLYPTPPTSVVILRPRTSSTPPTAYRILAKPTLSNRPIPAPDPPSPPNLTHPILFNISPSSHVLSPCLSRRESTFATKRVAFISTGPLAGGIIRRRSFSRRRLSRSNIF